MSKAVSARLSDDLEEAIEQYANKHDLNNSAAIRQLARRGVELETTPFGSRVLTRGAELSLISGLFAVIVAIGLNASQLYELAAGFGIIALALYSAYGVIARYQTGSWRGML